MGVEASMTDIGTLLGKAEQMGLRVSSMENQALRVGAQPILEKAKQNLMIPSSHHLGSKEFQKNSVRTGKLRDSIQIGNPKRDKLRGGRYIKVFTSYPTAHLVEFGHSGPAPAPPHPFMQPAYENTKNEAKEAIIETLKAGLKL